jgi:hypothetical protein
MFKSMRGATAKKSGKQVLQNAWVKNCMSVISDVETGELRCMLSGDESANIKDAKNDKDAVTGSRQPKSIINSLFGSSQPTPAPMLEAAEGSVAAIEKELEREKSWFGFGSTPKSTLPAGPYKQECFGCTYEKLSLVLACKACNIYSKSTSPKKSGKQVLKGVGGKNCKSVTVDTATGKLQCMGSISLTDAPPDDEPRLFSDKKYPTTPGEAKAIAGKSVQGRPDGAPPPPPAVKNSKPGKSKVDAGK